MLERLNLNLGKVNNRFGFNYSCDETMAALNEMHQRILQTEGERIRAQYGAVSDNDIIRIVRTEKEIARCKACRGLPCSKKKDRTFTPQIICNASYLDFTSYPCRYEKARRQQAQLERLGGLSKIPPEYLGKTFADYEVDENNSYAVKVAKRLIELPNQGAYFFGTVGTGKTLLAAIIAQEVIKRGRQVIFATIPTISMQIRSTFNGDTKTTEADILEKLYEVPTLILDDVGIEKPTRFICATISNIFNERYNARLQTIMTSNYRLKDLEQVFNNPTDSKEPTLDGTRIYSRCKQMCPPIELKGKDRRA